MGPEPDCYWTYERTDTADWEAITGPPLKHSENAGPWLHQLHQACSQQHETGVCLVDHVRVRSRPARGAPAVDLRAWLTG